MRFGTTQVIINAPFPVKQSGHMQQVTELMEYHDNLHARLLYLENQNTSWLHISIDSIQFKLYFQQTLENELKNILRNDLHVTVSGTHSHYCCDPLNERYIEFLLKTIIEAASSMEIKEMGDLTISYSTCPFEGVGKSRISNHTAESVQVDLFQIKKDGKSLADIVVHNVHPTVLYATTPYFSAEYPGYLLKCMNEAEPDVFHTFMNGPAGDISTRFTRKCQTYESVELLGRNLYEKVMEMKQEELPEVPLKLSFDSTIIPLEHQFHPIDMSKLPQNLTDRELETIGFGQIVRQQLKESPEQLEKENLFSCVNFGGPRIIFVPNEMFSWYRTQVNDRFCALVCYSNGQSPYITAPGKYLLTYETFTDTLTDETKQKLCAVLHQYGK